MDLVLTIVFIVIILVLLDYHFKPKLRIPSPPRLPILGHVLSLGKKPHQIFTKWKESHGDIYSIQLLNKEFLILSGEPLYDALVTQGKEYAGRPTTYRHQILAAEMRGVIAPSISPTWRKIRGLTHQLVKRHGEGLVYEKQVTKEIIDELIQSIKDGVKEKGFCDPYHQIYMSIANGIASMFLGIKYDLDDPILLKWLEAEQIVVRHLSLGEGTELDVMPWLRYFGNKSYKRILDLKALSEEIFAAVKSTCLDESNNNLNGMAFDLFKELKCNTKNIPNFNEKDIQQILSNLVVAGTATSSASLYAFLVLMASYPKVQEAVYQEIKDILQKKKDNDQFISMTDQDDMPYLKACLLEQQRYCSIVPIGAPHMTMEDTVVDGHHIPKGVNVIFNLWGLNHDERYWDKPWEFLPERFLDASGNLLPMERFKKVMLPFGGGPRICLGQSMAMAKLFVMGAALVQEFEVSPAPGMILQYDPRTYELGLALKPQPSMLCFNQRV